MTRSDPKTVAFVLYPGLSPLDIVGPLQAFGYLSLSSSEFRPVAVAESVGPLETDLPVKLVPSATFDSEPSPYALVVAGGTGPTLKAMADDNLLNYVRTAAAGAEIVASVCTGSMILAAAGLLEGRRATTHWTFHRLLEKMGAVYVPNRWVEDGKYLSSAGVTAGIDMALYLTARFVGEEVARQVQLLLEYDPEPPFGGIPWSHIDRDMMAPLINEMVAENLKDEPELLARLTG